MSKQQRNVWIGLILVLLLSWSDYQLLAESVAARQMAEEKRRICHLFFFTAILFAGFWGWYKQERWLRQLWLYLYTGGLSFVLAIGILHKFFYAFSVYFLDQVSAIRMFFISPLPYLLLILIQRISRSATLRK